MSASLHSRTSTSVAHPVLSAQIHRSPRKPSLSPQASRARVQFDAGLKKALDLWAAFQDLPNRPDDKPHARIAAAAFLLGAAALDQFLRARIEADLLALVAKTPSLLTVRARSLTLELGLLLRTPPELPLAQAVAQGIRHFVQSQTFLSSARLAEGLQYLKPGNFWTFAALGLGGTEEALRAHFDALIQAPLAQVEPSELDPSPGADPADPAGARVTESLTFFSRLVDCIEEYLR